MAALTPRGLCCSRSSCTDAAARKEKRTGDGATPRESSPRQCESGIHAALSPLSLLLYDPTLSPCSVLLALAHSQTAGVRGCFGGRAVRRSRRPHCGFAGSLSHVSSGQKGRKSGDDRRSLGSGKCQEVLSAAGSWLLSHPQPPSKTHSPGVYAVHTSPAGNVHVS